MKTISIVQEVEHGVVQAPIAFETLFSAAITFERKAVTKGFRAREVNESIDEYKQAWIDWTYTRECPFDAMDYELHHYEVEVHFAALIPETVAV
jgi:hypothetical protein